MVSNKHKEHEFFELSEVYKTKKKMIKNEKDKLEKMLIHWKTMYMIKKTNMDAKYEILTNEMLEQKNKWHREINFVFNKMKKKSV